MHSPNQTIFMKIAFLAVMLFLGSVSVAQADNGVPLVPVRVVDAEMQQLAPVSWVAGTVVGRHDSRISAEVEGQLESVADVGDKLSKGDVIARIDDLTLRLQVAEAEAAVARITARLRFNEREAKRLAQLAKENNAAKNRLDEVRSNRDWDQAELKAAEARLAQAKDLLDKTVIRAPFPGVVTERFQRAGERVGEGDPVVRLVNPDILEVVASAPPAAIRHVREGAELLIQENGDNLGVGTVRALVPVGDDRSHLYELRLDLSEPVWAAGQDVRVAVPIAAPRAVVTVPRDALVIRRDGIVVYRILDDGTAESVKVSTGIADGTLIEVVGPIQPGDQIVIRGNERLRPGQKVLIQPDPAAQ